MASITLDYFTLPAYQIPTALLVTRMAAPALDQGELDLLGYTIDSDVTAYQLDGTIRRRVVLGTTADSDALFPTDAERIYSTKGLFRDVISQGMPGFVTQSDPVVS